MASPSSCAATTVPSSPPVRLLDQNVGPAFIALGRPWQNGYVESFHGKLRDECLNREWFKDAGEAKVIVERGVTSTTASGRTAPLDIEPQFRLDGLVRSRQYDFPTHRLTDPKNQPQVTNRRG